MTGRLQKFIFAGPAPGLLCLALLAPGRVAAAKQPLASSPPILEFTRLEIDGHAEDFKAALTNGGGKSLRLPPGIHSLAFQFGPVVVTDENCLRLQYRMDGLDKDWQEVASPGMRVAVRFQNSALDFLDENEFYVLGAGEGWRGSVSNSDYLPRRERVVVPRGAVNMELLLVSGGTVDAVGASAIDDLTVSLVDPETGRETPWFNDDFETGADLDKVTGAPKGWLRGGLRRDILQIIRHGEGQTNHALAAVDTHIRSFGEWYRFVPLGGRIKAGDVLMVDWKQAYNVGYGKASHANYDYVPPGRYVFHVAGLSTPEGKLAAEITVPIYVPQHFWLTPSFIFFCSAAGALIVAGLARYYTRRRMRFQLERLEWQQSLERERTRIARDIHDDLGSGLTRISMLSASARDQARAPAHLTGELDEITQTARELVGAMDEIVWAVNPGHDKLDSLIAYCGKYAQDFFKSTGLQCRLNLALDVPDWTLTSQVRHNLFLAFKEALNNAARHAGARTVIISARVEGVNFILTIKDDGHGFDPSAPGGGGNGLANMQHRLSEIGGQCIIESAAGNGAAVKFFLKKQA
jgi:signal transduction histidine kinase